MLQSFQLTRITRQESARRLFAIASHQLIVTRSVTYFFRSRYDNLHSYRSGGWTQFPIVWDFVKRTAVDKAPPMEADPAIPALREGDAMHVAPPYYPEAALAARTHGIYKLHVMLRFDTSSALDSVG
jgi:hypothetical protein